jgi:hypothetical protein
VIGASVRDCAACGRAGKVTFDTARGKQRDLRGPGDRSSARNFGYTPSHGVLGGPSALGIKTDIECNGKHTSDNRHRHTGGRSRIHTIGMRYPMLAKSASGECSEKARPVTVIAQVGGKGGRELLPAGTGLRRALCQYFRDRPQVDGEEL